MKKVLIVGSDSMIGSLLFKYLIKKNTVKVIGTTRRSDLQTNHIYLNLENIKKFKPPETDVCVFCAGMTNIKECEEKKDLSGFINVTNTLKLMLKVSKTTFNTKFIFLSTSNFDNVYGKQKKLVEDVILEREWGTVLRISKVINSKNERFNSWKEKIKQGKKIYPLIDMSLSPVPAGFVVKVIYELILRPYDGVIECSNMQDLSYYHFMRLSGAGDLIQPRKSIDVRINPGPINSILDTHILRNVIGLTPPNIEWIAHKIFNDPEALDE